jgi:hypothetical protein
MKLRAARSREGRPTTTRKNPPASSARRGLARQLLNWACPRNPIHTLQPIRSPDDSIVVAFLPATTCDGTFDTIAVRTLGSWQRERTQTEKARRGSTGGRKTNNVRLAQALMKYVR